MLQASAVDLSRCAQEPIQIPGSIQPHGVLMVVSEPDLTVTQVSANIEALLGLSVSAACGASLSAMFTAAQVKSVRSALARSDAAPMNPLRFVFDLSGVAREFACIMHRFSGKLMLELEPFVAPCERVSVDLFAHVGTPISHMIGASDISTLVGIAAAEVREISGCAIDDFGTGYSSLSYLKRLPVDALKIDQSFIRELTPASDDSAIVRAVISMAHSLKMSVIAGGVETSQQLEYLLTEGCDSIQGYLVAKPLAHAAATAFVAQFIANPARLPLLLENVRLASD
jgi:hypothetical protein